MSATDAPVWQYVVLALAVAGSVLALAGHLSPALRAWLWRSVARLLRHRRLPASLRRLGERLAAAHSQAGGQGCGSCAGCASSAPRAAQPLVRRPRGVGGIKRR